MNIFKTIWRIVVPPKVKQVSELKAMTKLELEQYARQFDYEVDRRQTKDKIIKQVAKLK
jgi:hypothetical protein|tara:strand:+ start:352 stop:528 length:177 start_codon:yes stop_codon:yes gene_type:complete